MKRTKKVLSALSIGQLADRWNISPNRVRQLIVSGKLPGAFAIPASGRYGAATKIPLTTVIEAEAAWAVPASAVPSERKQKRRRSTGDVHLKNFPELSTPEPGAECPAGDQH